MRQVAELMDRVLTDTGNTTLAAAVRKDVRKLAAAFPLYPVAEEAPR
jgi:glycine/serine hydroxymethyltransferase